MGTTVKKSLAKRLRVWLFGGLAGLWGLSLLPGMVAREARSAFVQVAGHEWGVDVRRFTGPRRISYRLFTWHHVDPEGDSLFVDVTVLPYGFGFNRVTYRTPSPGKSLEDFPGVAEARGKE